MSKRKWRWLALLVLLVAAGVGWACWPDGRVARAKELQKELFAKGGALSAEQRREKWQELRGLTKQMTPAQRRELGAESRKRRQAEMARYFKMSPKEKERHLDGIIKRQEQMKKSQQAKGGGSGGGAPKGGAGDRSTKGRDDRRQTRLDSSMPAERAQMGQYMKELRERRARLGLAPGGGGARR